MALCEDIQVNWKKYLSKSALYSTYLSEKI